MSLSSSWPTSTVQVGLARTWVVRAKWTTRRRAAVLIANSIYFFKIKKKEGLVFDT